MTKIKRSSVIEKNRLYFESQKKQTSEWLDKYDGKEPFMTHEAMDRVEKIKEKEEVLATRREIERKRREKECAEYFLGLMSNGRYGICPGCKQKIKTERLDALPAAIYCISCANNHQ